MYNSNASIVMDGAKFSNVHYQRWGLSRFGANHPGPDDGEYTDDAIFSVSGSAATMVVLVRTLPDPAAANARS